MRTWVKLHTVILSDPKLFGMPDNLFRVTMNLMAVAGLVDDGGELGTAEDIAFHLRRDVESVTADLVTLSKIGITGAKKGVWSLQNWDKFQSPKSPSAEPEAVKERVRKSRNKLKTSTIEDECNDVTGSNGNEAVTGLEEKRKEEKRAEVVTPPPVNPTAAIQMAYEILLGEKLRSEDWVKQEGSAARLIGEKFTVEQLRRAYAHYKTQPFWADKRLTLHYLSKNMGALLGTNGRQIARAAGAGPWGSKPSNAK